MDLLVTTEIAEASAPPPDSFQLQNSRSTTMSPPWSWFSSKMFAFSAWSDNGVLGNQLRVMTMLLHQRVCSIGVCEEEVERWSSPFNLLDLDSTDAQLKTLNRCQIEMIERVGGISTYDLGLRFAKPPGDTTPGPEFCIDTEAREVDRGRVTNKAEVWRDRISLGAFLLAVPRRALELGALEWILDPEIYSNAPLVINPETFVSNAIDNEEMEKSEALQELGLALYSGVQKSVCVDMRGLNVQRKVVLFVPGSVVEKWSDYSEPVPALEMFELSHRKQLQLYLDPRQVVCYVWNMIGTVEICLTFKALAQEPTAELESSTSPSCNAPEEEMDEGVWSNNTFNSSRSTSRKLSKFFLGQRHFSQMPGGGVVINIGCSKANCVGIPIKVCSEQGCTAMEKIVHGTHVWLRIFMEKMLVRGPNNLQGSKNTFQSRLRRYSSRSKNFQNEVHERVKGLKKYLQISNKEVEALTAFALGRQISFIDPGSGHMSVRKGIRKLKPLGSISEAFLALHHHPWSPARHDVFARHISPDITPDVIEVILSKKVHQKEYLMLVGASCAAAQALADRRGIRFVCKDTTTY